MASNTQTVSKILPNLRDNGKILLQCAALTYIQRNAEKLDTTSRLSKEEYAEICKLIMDMATGANQDMRNKATKAMLAILKYFTRHDIKFFESALRIDRDKRLKIFQILEVTEDSSLAKTILDPLTVNFIEDCLTSIQSSSMEWLLPTSCTENLQMLVQVENKKSSDAQEFEELMVSNGLILLRRIYRTATISADMESVQKFDMLVMDKVMTLAYMGHKRQRGPAIRLMNQAIEADLAVRVKIKYPDVWLQYKKNVQSSYSTRMMLLVKACESDWSSLWAISIQLLGTDLHRGAPLINKLLSVEERAFKSTDTVARRQAFVSWKLLVDNLALDMKELATQRRVRLLCVPLIANNSRSELIALKKLEVWWYLITKLYDHLVSFADPVVTQFLNFCFGPLGDTPLLSTKFEVIASPGKRFYTAKIMAIDALLQLIVFKQKDRKMFAPILEDRLPNSITAALFKQCYKTFLHSVSEAVIIISQLHPSEMKNREDVCKVLWLNLMIYVRSASLESKTNLYNELLLVITALQARSLEVPFVNDFLCDVIIPELVMVADELVYYDRTLVDLMTKIMVPTFLKNLKGKHCDAVKSLMWQAVRPETLTNYHPDTLRFLEMTLHQLRLVPVDADSLTDCFELWFAYAEIAYKYMRALQDVNEGTATEPNFKTIESIISFPFTHMHWANSIQARKIGVHWKDVYKKYECQADTISGVKPNEIFDNTSKMIGACLVDNEKCYLVAVYCLDALMSTINYKFMLAQDVTPPIVRLIGDLTTIALHEGQPAEAECALKALSSLLITVYGHSPEKVLAYMSITSQTVELMLKTDVEDTLMKEITSTWETIVSILRGLSNLLDEKFLQSYKQVILLSMGHANTEISSQTLSVLELKENLKESAKSILAELAEECRKPVGRDSTKIKIDKFERTPKSARIVGSFLNRKTPSPRMIGNSGRGKDEGERKLAPLPPDPDSQDYVIIRSDAKLDVNCLTEHQKESLKRRRDDIPAMYNDLSQSSSQNTQDLQNWFVDKKKSNEPPKPLTDDEKSPSVDENTTKDKNIERPVESREEIVIEVPTVDEKIVTLGESEEKGPMMVPTPETIANSAQDPTGESPIPVELSNFNESEKSLDDERKELPMEKSNDFIDPSPLSDHSYVGGTKPPSVDSPRDDQASSTISIKLNFESRTEYPEERDKEHDENLSTDLTSGNRGNRGRRSGKAAVTNIPDEKVVQAGTRGVAKTRSTVAGMDGETRSSESQEIPNSATGKSRAGVKGKGSATKRSQTSASMTERGRKRKASSDSEIEESERDKRRRKLSSSPSDGHEDNKTGNAPSASGKRTEIEMSRLRIDMISDGPLTSRRRSKYNEDFVSSETLGKRSHSPDRKGLRGKGLRSRGTPSNPRRSSRASTDNEDVAGKKRRRRVAGADDDGRAERIREDDESQTKPVKARGRRRKNVQESGAPSESQIIIDDYESMEDSASLSREADKLADATGDNVELCSIPVDEVVPSPSPSPIPPSVGTTTNPVVKIVATPMENDLDEVIESSQDSNVLTGSHKRSFGKIAKLKSTQDTKSPIDPPVVETMFEIAQPTASSPVNSLAVTPSIDKENNPVEEKIVTEDPDETFLDISAIRPQLADDVPIEDIEKRAPEASKTTVSPVPIKASEVNFNFSSPKGHSRRYAKPKGFASQGRAAHMLGLVTKLAALERDGQVEKSQVEEEIATIKRLKTRETDSETVISKRDRPSNIAREPERLGSPSGSRQEKIFNNMKAADYGASPPSKLFGNLRNNGEKISPKMEKSQATHRENNGALGRKDDDEDGNDASLTNERDELPMLEWSSANPPSLTASPSASILKRNRSIVGNDVETEPTTPNRTPKKRVSFADPPVSREMGYETEAADSIHRVSKFGTPRGFLVRKDSPIRIKQTRFLMIQMDNEKTERPEEPRNLNCDVDMNCERDNELLMKIAEDLEDTVNFQTTEQIDSPDMSVMSTSVIDNIAEYEMLECEKLKDTSENITTEAPGEATRLPNSSAKCVPVEEAPTQDDLFNSSDEKLDSPKRPREDVNIDVVDKEQFNMSGQNSTIESFKLNVTDDSLIGINTDTPREETAAPESLEDTMDAGNITGLNSTGNSDEASGDVNARNQAPDPVSEMDTLPVTDSITASLPMTQDSQGSTQGNVEIERPEMLNSTDAVYPNLDDCHRPIEEIIDSLTNPLWRKNLMKHLETRCIRTVGDLARLSEREIVRIPVKGSSKINFVRKILAKFDQKLRDERANNNVVAGSESLAACTEKDETTNINNNTEVNELPREIRKSLGDISALACTSKLPGDSAVLDVSALGSQAPNDFVSVEDLNPHDRDTLKRTSTTISTIIIDTSAEVTAVPNDPTIVSLMSTINLSSDTILPTTNSVATWTDSPATMSVKSVASQTEVDQLLDRIDASLVLQSAVRRTSAEKLMAEYKLKMEHMSEAELCKETLRILGIQSETVLKLACRECGLKKVLSELPDIFYNDHDSNCQDK